MEIRPSVYTDLVDRRIMQAWEMEFGGQGQVLLTNCTTAPSGYVFYQIDFLSTTQLSAIGYYGSYNITTSQFNNQTFPANFTWYVPVTSVCFYSGSAVGYLYKIPTNCCAADPLAFTF